MHVPRTDHESLPISDRLLVHEAPQCPQVAAGSRPLHAPCKRSGKAHEATARSRKCVNLESDEAVGCRSHEK
jgi:hypothetical protein